MRAVNVFSLMAASCLFTGVSVAYFDTKLASEKVALAVPALKPAPVAPPKPRFTVQQALGSTVSVYLVTDTKTGREFLVPYSGGIAEIKPSHAGE